MINFKEFYNEENEVKGWMLAPENCDTVFAIGNISDDEIQEAIEDDYCDVVRCENYVIEAWNIPEEILNEIETAENGGGENEENE